MEMAIATKNELASTDQNIGDIMLNVPLLAQIDQMALRMSKGRATVPKHLQDNEGDCWAIIMQALQWKMNPFVVAQKTHVVNGTLGYEAQLVLAVAEASGAIEGHFHYQYDGEGPELRCRVGAILRGDKDITWNEWLSLSSVKVKNSPLWQTNQKQQMGYLQGKNFCRAYAPGAILGIYTPDELQEVAPRGEREIGPVVSDLNDALKKRAETVKVVDAVVVEDDPKPTKKGRPAPQPEPEPEELPLAAETTYADVMAAINAADSPETIQAAKALMIGFCGEGDNSQFQEELGAAYRYKLSELKGKK
jgi:hypothetical protein